MSGNFDMTTTGLSEHILRQIESSNRFSYIGIPARVVKVSDYEKHQCVDVVPVINDIYESKDVVTLNAPTIKKVFVALTHGGGFSIKPPVAVGNLVRLNWSHRDLGDFLDSDGKRNVDLDISKRAELEDCWVELGFGTRKVHQNPSQTDFIINSDATEIRITPEGVVTVNTEGTSYIKSSHHTIDTDVTITGDCQINKTLTVDSTSTLTDFVTAAAGVYAGTYAGISGGAATFEVDMGITGTVTINGINVNTHIHEEHDGHDTGGMK